jgi:hypothetical protein
VKAAHAPTALANEYRTFSVELDYWSRSIRKSPSGCSSNSPRVLRITTLQKGRDTITYRLKDLEHLLDPARLHGRERFGGVRPHNRAQSEL